MFEVSAARREILEKLAERDWSPTDLAEELGKSSGTVYNHLKDLEEQGILTKTRVEAKTRPKTQYSIGDGLIQYITVLPGQFQEGSLRVNETKEAMFRIWALPQDEFHPYLEDYWWSLRQHVDVDFYDDITSIGVYGSVARGEAGEESDIDILVVTPDEGGKTRVEYGFGSTVLEYGEGKKIGMTEVYTEDEYRNSLARGSDFLTSVMNELHSLYDPERFLMRREVVVLNE